MQKSTQSNQARLFQTLSKLTPQQYDDLIIAEKNVMFCWAISKSFDLEKLQREFRAQFAHLKPKHWIFISNAEYDTLDAFIILDSNIVITSATQQCFIFKRQKVKFILLLDLYAESLLGLRRKTKGKFFFVRRHFSTKN